MGKGIFLYAKRGKGSEESHAIQKQAVLGSVGDLSKESLQMRSYVLWPFTNLGTPHFAFLENKGNIQQGGIADE